MQLKTNFHLHIADDPQDKIPYTAYDALNRAAELGFEVISFTCHREVVHKKEYEEYAKSKNILLIPGIEASIEKKDVVIINCGKDAEKIKTFKDLRDFRGQNPQILIIAPHPYVPFSGRSLGEKLIENIDLFDAIELSIFSNEITGTNRKAKETALKYKKPLVATSDTHELGCLKRGYTVINAENKTAETILDAVKNGNLKNEVMEMSMAKMLQFKIFFGVPLLLHSVKLFCFPPGRN